MREIHIPKVKSDNFIHQIEAFYHVFRNIDPHEKVEFDLSRIGWLYPLVVLPIAAHICETGSLFKQPCGKDVNNYLNTLGFPNGIGFLNRSQWRKNYLPITILKRVSYPDNREHILGCIFSLIYQATGAVSGSKNALYYPISELVDNIFEHSKKDCGFIFGQVYPKKKYLELCILDRGRGLAKSYKEEKNKDLTPYESILAALSGESVKKDTLRGRGIITSKKTVCKLLNGDFMLLSGNAVLVATKDDEKMFELPKFNWQGVIIFYRIPFPRTAIDIYGIV